ncbi:aspartic-type endopeptidase (CtsD), putative [Metarhizium acridum CQMa 102]|uniref:Aspartic-type endopeptidase (CtsD), putative n=1 Tax=Metarhizium acridum (strain CQMa 102) TaxID=655827 RepID=E9DW11_METAQ|nr:aspartic-type endopeptidase (CtsD), putative [Metarhizium acridum CQMa 102]EFY92208.1 aspartic-type endopeptidase (CtsD), putative [Metarhizium acridum CQMa 102]
MFPAVLLLQLALWAVSTSAFYPYTPGWLKEKEDVTLDEAKRSSAVGDARDGLIFRIEKRTQENESPAVLAAEQAAWLKHKFKHSRSGAPVNAVEKRASQYKIMEATEPSEVMAAGITQDGTDYSYFVKVGLGSKGKQVYLLVDTGAGSTWVMGSGCTDTPCSTHTTFGQGDSSTFTDVGKSFSVSYGSGAVQGKLVTDTINVAGISLKYTFGQASKTSDVFSHFAFDGILGMSMGQGDSDNFLKTLVEARKLDKNLFSIHLNRASDGSNNGEIKFGSTNPNKYTGDISYTSIGSKKGDWAIQIDDMAYDGKKADAGGVLSYIDTGTSFIFGPPSLVKKIHNTIPGSSSSDGLTYTVPCSSNKSLSFTFSGVDYKISSKDWISPKDSSGNCTSNLYGHEVVDGAWLLGDTFLKNVYAVFDADQKRIGFAAPADFKGGPSSSSSSGSSSPTPTTVGLTTVATTALTTGETSQPDFSTQSKRPPLGLSGHETGSTRSSSATAKPTESTKSAAPDASARQTAKLAVVFFFAALAALVA